MIKSGWIRTWLARQKEREVLNLCRKHTKKIVETVSNMRKVAYAFSEGDTKGVSKVFKEVFRSEREADETKRNILNELSKGPFHPMDREEIVRLVLTIDDVADNAKTAARKMGLSSPEGVTEEIKTGLRGLSDRLVKIAEKMDETFNRLIEEPETAIKLAQEVERMEEEIDDYQVELVMKILRFGDKTKSFSAWLMLKEAVENMEEVADRSEDVADIIRSIVILR